MLKEAYFSFGSLKSKRNSSFEKERMKKKSLKTRLLITQAYYAIWVFQPQIPGNLRSYQRQQALHLLSIRQSIHRAAMRGRPPLRNAARAFRELQRPKFGIHGRRAIQISATPTTESPILNGDLLSSSIDADSAGKTFRHS